MSEECVPLIQSASDAGLGSDHPPLLMDPVLVATATNGEKNTVRAAIVPVACWRMDDVRFEFDSSLVLVDAADEFMQLAVLRRLHVGAPLSMFGHADPVGDDSYNKKLSGRRVRSVYAVLARKTALWEDLYQNALGRDDWKKNGALEALLGATGRDPGTAGDYQKDAGRRAALFKEYMDLICRDDSGKPYELKATDFLAQGADPDGKGDYQGCGEFNPVRMFSQEEKEAFDRANDKTERDEANAPNRRVNAYLFRPGCKVKPNKWPCSTSVSDAGACHKRFWSDAAKRRKFQKERREFKDTQDTFACRFYQRIAASSPCEAGVERSMPLIYFPPKPGSPEWVLAHSLWVYVVHFMGEGPKLESVRRCSLKEGRLWDEAAKLVVPIACNRKAWFYFTHRPDLILLDRDRWFKSDRSGLPLLGPFCVPCGPDARLRINIWNQEDWAVVYANLVDGQRLEKVKMADWQENYKIGNLWKNNYGQGFTPYGNFRQKRDQEVWNGGANLSEFIHLGDPDKTPMWVGTLSALPKPKAKLLLIRTTGFEEIHVTSYNEIAPTGSNQEFPSYHLFDSSLVDNLLAVSSSGQSNEEIDALPDPPARVLLPGDACWQNQGASNNCGPFSFSTVMNYWMPYSNNPNGREGWWYSNTSHVPDKINGAREPANIETACERYGMNGRDNDAEDVDRRRALKLIKLWLCAGVPVLILVKETYNLWSYHWKTLVGYDGNRYFMNNTGAEHEQVLSNRTGSIDYDHAPIGNDADPEDDFYKKWHVAGGDIADASSTVDRCTFIPIYPKDAAFAAAGVL